MNLIKFFKPSKNLKIALIALTVIFGLIVFALLVRCRFFTEACPTSLHGQIINLTGTWYGCHCIRIDSFGDKIILMIEEFLIPLAFAILLVYLALVFALRNIEKTEK